MVNFSKKWDDARIPVNDKAKRMVLIFVIFKKC